MQEIATDLMRLPPKERLLKIIYGVVGGGALVLAVNAVGPSVYKALKTATGIATAAGELALMGALLATLLTGLWLAAPAVKTLLKTLAYRSLLLVNSKYPIEQLNFEHQAQLDDIDKDRAAVAKIAGEVQAAQDEADLIQADIDTLTAAAQDPQISPETREQSQLDLGGKLNEIKPYREIIAFGESHIAVANQMISVAERVAAAYKRGIASEVAMYNMSGSLEAIAETWNERFSAKGRLTRRNAEQARDAIHRRFALAKGAINGLRPQLEAMIRAHQQHDEIAAANARRHIENAVRTIEIPMVEVVGSNKSARPQVGFIKIGQRKAGN